MTGSRHPSFPWIVALALAVPGSASAAGPFRGTGTAPTTEPEARKLATSRARRAALEQAMVSVGIAPTGDARVVLDEHETWTRAYRVLSGTDDGATATVVVEVEIDEPRLHKRLSGKRPVPTQELPQLGRVTLDWSCAAAPTSVAIGAALRALGAVGASTSGPALDVGVSCRDLGPLELTHDRAHEIGLTARQGRAEVAIEKRVYGPPGDGAALLREPLRELARRIAAGRSGRVVLSVHGPRPIAWLRRLERVLVDAGSGVHSAALHRIAPDGSWELEVRGATDGLTLARQLPSLQFGGFSATIVGDPSRDGVHVELVPSP